MLVLYTISAVPFDVVVYLRVFPFDLNLITGQQLNLTCIIHVYLMDLDISPSMTVSAKWSKSGSFLTSNSRVTVEERPVEVWPLKYQTSLLINSLDKSQDEGEYMCDVHVTVRVHGFVVVKDSTISRSISVQSKSHVSHYNTERFLIRMTSLIVIAISWIMSSYWSDSHFDCRYVPKMVDFNSEILMLAGTISFSV